MDESKGGEFDIGAASDDGSGEGGKFDIGAASSESSGEGGEFDMSDASSKGSGDKESEYLPSNEASQAGSSSDDDSSSNSFVGDKGGNQAARAEYIEYDQKVATRVYQRHLANLGEVAQNSDPAPAKRSRGQEEKKGGKGKAKGKRDSFYLSGMGFIF